MFSKYQSKGEIVLYRVEASESCVMTTACLFAYEDYMAQGIAETDVLCAGIPKVSLRNFWQRPMHLDTSSFLHIPSE